MGATVQLFNRFGDLIRKVSSSRDGRFSFPYLPAETYSISVSFADYLPARRDGIPVRAGLNSLLQIHLATLLSTVELTYAVPSGGMSKEWKWVLRSSPTTRPITRFQPDDVSVSTPADGSRVFSQTHAVLSLSGGVDTLMAPDSPQTDMGTGFALSTSIFQKNQLQLGGSIAQNAGFAPAAMGLYAIYTRDNQSGFGPSSPEVTMTLSQVGVMDGSMLSTAAGLSTQLSTVRTMSVSIYQAMDLDGLVRLEYGTTGEDVEYVEHTTRVSPFARLTTSLGAAGKVVASYSDGGRPDELQAHSGAEQPAEADAAVNNDVATPVNSLSRLPQLSYRNDRLTLQRTASYEIGYQKVQGSRTYAVSSFAEDVSNGRVDVAGDTSALGAGNLLSDGMSPTSIYDIGKFQRTGVVASVNQQWQKTLNLSLAYGRMGGLTADSTILGPSNTNGFGTLKSYDVANGGMNFKAPKAATKISANYGWINGNVIIPRHLFTTQNTDIAPGLNVMVRQPLPSLFGMPGHLELSADLRNLLAQGYLPVDAGGGRTLLMVQSPRAIRGGLNFRF